MSLTDVSGYGVCSLANVSATIFLRWLARTLLHERRIESRLLQRAVVQCSVCKLFHNYH